MKSIPTALALTLLLLSTTVSAQVLDTAMIASITKLSGSYNQAEKVFKVSKPRTDVDVTVDGRKLKPFMGLTSWVSFQAGKGENTMIMGDLVLFEDEVNPIMSSLLDAKIEVTALHNHFFYAEPRVCFMHIGGEGKTADLAQAVRSAFDSVTAIRQHEPKVARLSNNKSLPDVDQIDIAPLNGIMKAQGQAKEGMVKYVIGREATMDCGCKIGKEMGVNTWAAFAGTDDNAVVDGDFAVLESELQSVLQSLRRSGIDIVAIHHHMTEEDPKYIFLHYWGRGTASGLAQGVRAALDRLDS
jgi:hypothetical protein